MDESIFDQTDKDETQEPSPEGADGDVEAQRAEVRKEQSEPQDTGGGEPDARDAAATGQGGPGF